MFIVITIKYRETMKEKFHVYKFLYGSSAALYKFLRDYKALQAIGIGIYLYIYIYMYYVEVSATPLEAFHAWERRAWLSVPVASDLDWTSRSNDRPMAARLIGAHSNSKHGTCSRRRIPWFREGPFIVFIVPRQRVLYIYIYVLYSLN